MVTGSSAYSATALATGSKQLLQKAGDSFSGLKDQIVSKSQPLLKHLRPIDENEIADGASTVISTTQVGVDPDFREN